MPKIKKVKRMTVTMRIIHWVTVLSMIIAVVTGLYIGHPYYQTFIADPAVDKYVMAWNRWWHFIVAIIFDVTAILVGYLYFFSRFEKPYKKLIPNKQNLVEFWEVLLNLITLNRRKKFDSTHSDSFNTVFFTVFHLLLVLMLFTGLQLYVHALASGTSSIGAWWPAMLHLVTDWTLYVFGGNMGVRYVHHFCMYLILMWVIFHIYYQVWRTIFWQEGDIAIVVGGSKFVKEKEEDKKQD
ncbi:Ni/Fe-hydrogenase, b-type cytochrome subunit [Malaciobacter pacificus]|uniref:[Ni-Fe] hydrogenase, cytochrome b subunit n=2 Tax=Malaciobacter pacificus TaxID=1080223 RepID=A0A5C2H7D3_9BACT|nr:[Ni-Fe] hydrogenase, cytochrome b subunit [Malaciobacter pacificus]GGD43095.1 Ni/Fe-hydrogenase, b-type cytochrome subunit [Malaciobacter pacificus]